MKPITVTIETERKFEITNLVLGTGERIRCGPGMAHEGEVYTVVVVGTGRIFTTPINGRLEISAV